MQAEPPLELRGPFRRGALPAYHLRNVTAGIFQGDSYGVDVCLDAGARAWIGASSATKVHDMPGGSAGSDVVVEAGPGSRLIWGPHVTILQAGSHFRQQLEIRLKTGARVVIAEVLVFGRLARGERSRFRQYASDLTVCSEQRILYEERFDIQPGPHLDQALAGFGALASVYVLGADAVLARDGLEAVARQSRAWAGVTDLPNGAGVLLRGLAGSLSVGERLATACLQALPW